jgi:hypothetical protein
VRLVYIKQNDIAEQTADYNREYQNMTIEPTNEKFRGVLTEKALRSWGVSEPAIIAIHRASVDKEDDDLHAALQRSLGDRANYSHPLQKSQELAPLLAAAACPLGIGRTEQQVNQSLMDARGVVSVLAVDAITHEVKGGRNPVEGLERRVG